MSDFLLNLARRSAGLAPAVQSRVEPIPESDPRADGDVVDAAPLPPPAPPLTAGPANRVDAPAIAAPVAGAIVERPIASLSTPVVQREPMAAVAVTPPAPLVMPVAPALAPAPEPRGADIAARLPQPTATFEPPAERPAPAPMDPVHASERVVEQRVESRIEHELTRVVEQPVLQSREIVHADAVRDDGQADRPPIVGPSPVAVVLAPRLEPASEPAIPRPSPPAPSLAEPSQVVERTVQVRIGTIEIHGTDAAAPAAAPPAPPPPPSAQGFDAFARLRSYAPWSW